jgi:lysozyme family protein
MHRNFERSLSAVLKHEGGYVDHPKDPGGATNLGITIGTAKSNRMDLDRDGDVDKADVRLIKASDAGPVYKARYWDTVRGDDLPAGVDYAVFDFAVNSGPARAAMYLQEIVGVAPDGKIGPLTLQAVAGWDSVAIIDALCAKRMGFLKQLSTWPSFGKGWSSRVTGVLRLAKDMAITMPGTPIPAPAQAQPEAPSGRGAAGWLILAAVVAAALVYVIFIKR